MGPRMLCVHRDGSQSIEWAATTCCGGGRAETAASESECGGGKGNCDDDQNDGLELNQPDCDCVDSPMAGEPMARQAPQSAPQDELVATFAAVFTVLVMDTAPVNPSGFAHRAALPECLAPPRAHLATIVLRL